MVKACQAQGFVTEHTYECLHNAVDSIREDPEDKEAADREVADVEVRIERLGDPSAADELVHDIYSGMAANVNNEGPAGQAACLVKHLGCKEALAALDAWRAKP